MRGFFLCFARNLYFWGLYKWIALFNELTISHKVAFLNPSINDSFTESKSTRWFSLFVTQRSDAHDRLYEFM